MHVRRCRWFEDAGPWYGYDRYPQCQIKTVLMTLRLPLLCTLVCEYPKQRQSHAPQRTVKPMSLSLYRLPSRRSTPFGKGYFAVGADEGLLVNPAYTLDMPT